jgi:hypothetical protein
MALDKIQELEGKQINNAIVYFFARGNMFG